MKFVKTPIGGVLLIEIEPVTDMRGHFARTFCAEEFRRQGLETQVAQCSMAFTARAGTVRGMHYQRDPHGEAKLVRCTRGAVHDAVIDLRPDSPTFRQWFGIEISASSRRMIYVPPGLAHGYQSLEDETEVAYQMSTAHRPDAEAGVRWDDPSFGVRWPQPVTLISERDRSFPDFLPSR